MAFQVFDYRSVNRNVLVTPEIRARLYHMKPGQVDRRHSHDLGHEVFLILEGKAEFEIDGARKVLGPGEMCVALADEIHQVRNLLPDQPTIMYLSVTPHIQPTHTGRDEHDQKLPPHFAPNANYDDEQGGGMAVEEALAAEVEALAAVVGAAQQALATHREQADQLTAALAEGERDAAIAARNAMWEAVYRLHKEIYAFGAAWNRFAPTVEPAFDSPTQQER